MSDFKSIKEMLASVDMEDWDLVVFKGEDGEGEISGILAGDSTLIQAISEGFELKDVEEVDLDDYKGPEKDDIIH